MQTTAAPPCTSYGSMLNNNHHQGNFTARNPNARGYPPWKDGRGVIAVMIDAASERMFPAMVNLPLRRSSGEAKAAVSTGSHVHRERSESECAYSATLTVRTAPVDLTGQDWGVAMNRDAGTVDPVPELMLGRHRYVRVKWANGDSEYISRALVLRYLQFAREPRLEELPARRMLGCLAGSAREKRKCRGTLPSPTGATAADCPCRGVLTFYNLRNKECGRSVGESLVAGTVCAFDSVDLLHGTSRRVCGCVSEDGVAREEGAPSCLSFSLQNNTYTTELSKEEQIGIHHLEFAEALTRDVQMLKQMGCTVYECESTSMSPTVKREALEEHGADGYPRDDPSLVFVAPQEQNLIAYTTEGRVRVVVIRRGLEILPMFDTVRETLAGKCDLCRGTVQRGKTKGANEHGAMVGVRLDSQESPGHATNPDYLTENARPPANLDTYIPSAKFAESFYGETALRTYAAIARVITAALPTYTRRARHLNACAEVSKRTRSVVSDRESVYESTRCLFAYGMWRDGQATTWHTDERDVGMAVAFSVKCGENKSGAA